MRASQLRAVTLVLIPLFLNSASSGPIPRPSDLAAQQQSCPQLIDATIETLTAGLDRRQFTTVDLVKAYLARIAEVNDALHAVTEVNPDALAIAAELDAERAAGSIRGPLHGIPILVKNNIATYDKMNTTAGSWALLGAKVPRDATVAQKLRAAGAILLGKANLSQWADWRSLNSSNGWSALGGQVYGPYFPDEDPNGSSSGSGVASTLGLALGCLGTETDGSILSPSSLNNLVGIKPSVGLTSRHLVIPVSEHQDTVGPMARTVKDAARILHAIAGVDPYDNYTSAIPKNGSIPDYVAACNLSALSGARLGVPRNVISLFSDNTTGPITDAFEEALGIFEAAGAMIVDNTNFTAAKEFKNSTLPTEILNADFVVNLQSYLELLTDNPNNITSLAVLRNFTQAFPLEDYPIRDTGEWDKALQNWNNTDPRFWPAYQQNMFYGGEGGLLGAIERNNLDAVILPTKFGHDYAAVIGSPVVTVPLGSYPAGTPIVKNSWGLVQSAPNLPFGISFLGPKFTETTLIGLAYAFEQKTKIRDKIQPYIIPSIELADVMGK
ncbi:amidase signature enzyme [Cenococcum geophilum 1.58]|uniref:amidase signature enzyme n=1 Tax=Cenococcum geophilum 1.58 TaxID=794803 RepID=UPI00358E593F|nr:amidase signature enzyme [Cenococcum geophilum 1.58]